MPKGTVALPLLPPSGGYQPSIPQHQAQPNTIVDGLNVLYSSYFGGRLVSRPGFAAVGGGFGTDPVTGIFSCVKSDGTTQCIAADTKRWWSIDSSWVATDITASLNTGGETDYWRFVFFPQGGVDYIIGTNNINAVHRWQIGAANYTSPAAFPICKDVIVLNNRVVALNLVNGGTRYTYGVQWSAVNDATTWPATALALLADSDDPIISARAINRESAIIYRASSIWRMTAQAGGDATAFRFDLVERVPGPATGPSVYTFQGIDYYQCQDLRVRAFDGTRTSVIGDPIVSLGASFVDQTGDAYRPNIRHAFYHNGSNDIWWIYGTPPQFAIPYNPVEKRWEVKQQFNTNFYSSHYGYGTFSAPHLPYTILGGLGQLYLLSVLYSSDNGAAIPFSWTTPKMSPGTQAAYLPDELEDYFVVESSGTDTVAVNVYGFEQPEQLDSTKTTLLSGTYSLATGPRFRLKPALDLSATARGRYLQITYSGSATQLLKWSGGFLYVYPEAD